MTVLPRVSEPALLQQIDFITSVVHFAGSGSVDDQRQLPVLARSVDSIRDQILPNVQHIISMIHNLNPSAPNDSKTTPTKLRFQAQRTLTDLERQLETMRSISAGSLSVPQPKPSCCRRLTFLPPDPKTE